MVSYRQKHGRYNHEVQPWDHHVIITASIRLSAWSFQYSPRRSYCQTRRAVDIVWSRNSLDADPLELFSLSMFWSAQASCCYYCCACNASSALIPAKPRPLRSSPGIGWNVNKLNCQKILPKTVSRQCCVPLYVADNKTENWIFPPWIDLTDSLSFHHGQRTLQRVVYIKFMYMTITILYVSVYIRCK